eukprot:4570510-Pleurochrysis_carterae.AAC.2
MSSAQAGENAPSLTGGRGGSPPPCSGGCQSCPPSNGLVVGKPRCRRVVEKGPKRGGELSARREPVS